MATEINTGVLDAKDKCMDDLAVKFHQKVEAFTSQAKRKIRSLSSETANQMFGMVLAFLTQAVPDLTKPPRGPPKSLSLWSTYTATAPGESEGPVIHDMKLLPGGSVLLSDKNNRCVKLFDMQGRHIQKQALKSKPFCMAVMDIKPQSGWDVAVTLPLENRIAVLHVTPNSVSLKTPIETSKSYAAIAAMTDKTLAMGNWCGHPCIDLIDLSGQILRHLSSTLCPWRMVTTPDNCLVMSLPSNELVKLRLQDDAPIFNHAVPQMTHPAGVTCCDENSFIVADQDKRSLHLIDHNGVWITDLWTHPGGKDRRDPLHSVSVLDGECACCTEFGSVFILSLSY